MEDTSRVILFYKGSTDSWVRYQSMTALHDLLTTSTRPPWFDIVNQALANGAVDVHVCTFTDFDTAFASHYEEISNQARNNIRFFWLKENDSLQAVVKLVNMVVSLKTMSLVYIIAFDTQLTRDDSWYSPAVPRIIHTSRVVDAPVKPWYRRNKYGK